MEYFNKQQEQMMQAQAQMISRSMQNKSKINVGKDYVFLNLIKFHKRGTLVSMIMVQFEDSLRQIYKKTTNRS